MSTARELYNNLKRFDTVKESRKCVDLTKEEIVKLNVEQLGSGYNSEMQRFRSYRSKLYASKKNAMNPQPGMWNPDLILTGAFTESFKIDLSGDDLKFSATDSKTKELTEKYGDDIFGLSENQQEYYNEEVFLPEFQDSIEKETGLKFSNGM